MATPFVPRWQSIWRSIGLLLTFLLIASVLATWTSAAPDSGGIEEADLNPSGEAYEINLDSQGRLVLSDYGAGEVWRINPADGVYSIFGSLIAVLDAQPDASGKIWFVDGVDSFAVLDPVGQQGARWTLGNSELSLQAIAFDPQGNVWIAEGFGQTSKLYRFNPSTHEWCPYSLPGGSYAYDLIYEAGFLYQTNWGSDRVFKFEIATEQLTRWNIAQDTTPKGLALDADKKLWWADAKLAALVRFDTKTGEMSSFSLPFGSKPVMLNLNNGLMWYTEDSTGTPNPPGTVGSLEPGLAQATSTFLSPFTQSLPHDACSDLGAGSPFAATLSSGVLSWSASTASLAYNQAGWKVYQLPDGAIPYGISSSNGRIWAADQGRQVIVRLPLDFSVFLPFVTKE